MAVSLPREFTVDETSGFARSGGDPLIWPIAIPFAESENITNTDGLRVRDLVANATRACQLVPGPRYGNIDDTSKPLRVAWLYFRPTLNAGEMRRLHQIEQGAPPATTNPVSATVSGGNIIVANGVCTWNIPRTGPQSIIRKCILTSGNRTAIDSDAGGLFVRGVDTDYIGQVRNQGHEYYSRQDTSGDGTPNGARATDYVNWSTVGPSGPRPGKWETRILINGPEIVLIRISNIRNKDLSGIIFKGGPHLHNSQPAGVTVNWDETLDVFLWFYANTALFTIDKYTRGTGGHVNGQNISRISDLAKHSCGIDFALAWSGANAKITVRDEAAASKGTTVTAASSISAKQQHNLVLNSNGFSIAYSGITPAGANTTWNEAFIDSTKTDNTVGFAIFPWNFRNYYPQGVAYDFATGNLRWECLTGVPDIANNEAHHVQYGFQYFMWRAMCLPHTGALTAAQLAEQAKRHAGVMEKPLGGVYQPTVLPSGPGGQIPSMLGSVDSELWHRTQAFWDSLPPNDTAQMKAAMRAFYPAGSTNEKAWPAVSSYNENYPSIGNPPTPKFVGNTIRAEDAVDMFWQWRYARADYVRARTRLNTDDLSLQALPRPNVRGVQIGWREYGGQGTSGGACGANDYEGNSALAVSWLLTKERAFFLHGLTCTLHHAMIDHNHASLYLNNDAWWGMGTNTAWKASLKFHAGLSIFDTIEYQQFMEDFPVWYTLTGHPIFRDSMEWAINFIGRFQGGELPGINEAHYGTFYDNYELNATVTAGSNVLTNVSVIPRGGLAGDFNRIRPNGHGPLLVPISRNPTGVPSYLLNAYTISSVNAAAKTITLAQTPAGSGVVRCFAINYIGAAQARQWTWPMKAVTFILRALGPNVDTGYTGQFGPRDSLATWLANYARKFVHLEQIASSPALRASASGGCGTWAVATSTVPAIETYSTYPVLPLCAAHHTLNWLMGTQWAGEVQQYTLDALEGLLIRIYKLQLAGVNADSVRLNASGTDRRLIWQAGGEVLGPASAITARSMTFELHMFKSSNKIENTFDDFNNFPAGQQMWGGSTQAGAGIHGSEMAAYIAKAIYHRDGDTARRDHALRLSLLGFVINLLWSGIPSASPPKPEIGQLSDPHQTQWTTPYLLSTQVVPSPEIRNKHWLHNTFYSIRTLVDGFTDEVPTQISLFGSTDIRIQLSTPTLQDSAVAAQLVGTVEINIVGVADLVPGIPSEEGGIGVFRPPIPNRPIIAVERPANPKNMALRGLVAIGIQPAGDLVIELLLAGEIALNINPVGQLFAALQETFTAADSSAGDIDGDLDWTAMHATPTWRISGNVALFENGPTYATKAMRCEADIGSADIDAVALIGRWDVNTAVDAWCGLIVRMDASAMTGYIAHLHKRANEDAHDVVLWRAVNGTWSALATSAIVANPTIGTTALRVRIKTVGGNPVITVFYEGQQVLEHEDTAANKITTGSRIGLWAGMGPRTATISLGIATVNADVAS